MDTHSKYYDTERVAKNVREGHHRLAVGDMWDEVGALQLSFMREQGLEPHHTLLDLGCGSLRGGVRFVDYLDSGNYFGIDINQSLLDAGYDIELERLGLQGKLPRDSLLCDSEFSVEKLGRSFDFVLALSLFTHLPLNHIRICLEQLAPYLPGTGQAFATYFEIPTSHQTHGHYLQQPGGLTTYATREPYHYHLEDLHWLASTVGLTTQRVPFEHPRGQRMLRFMPLVGN